MLTTGSPSLDIHFKYCDSINCIYGKASTGKTNLCLLLASKLAKEKKIFFIDTEGSFSPERIKQFEGEDSLKNIFVLKANDFNEQCIAIEKLLNFKKNMGLVIVDSLSMHYRKEIQERNERANSKLSRQLSILAELTREGIPVIITTQVYSRFDNSIVPVGSDMIRNWSQCLIRLDNEHKRKIIIEKHPELESKEINFSITTEEILANV